MGSADIYQTVEGLPEVREALVVGVELSLEGYYMPLFVELADGVDLERARGTIVDAIRYGLSPRHVPDDVIAVPGIPHTKTGKKLEVPIKRLLQGATIRDVVDPDAVDRADLLEFYSRFAADREAGRKA
jgi:acetoacetyl-CoA synthetase